MPRGATVLAFWHVYMAGVDATAETDVDLYLPDSPSDGYVSSGDTDGLGSIGNLSDSDESWLRDS